MSNLYEIIEVGMKVGIARPNSAWATSQWKIAEVQRVTKTTVVADGITFNRNFCMRERGSGYSGLLLVSHEVALQHNADLDRENLEQREAYAKVIKQLLENVDKIEPALLKPVWREAKAALSGSGIKIDEGEKK